MDSLARSLQKWKTVRGKTGKVDFGIESRGRESVKVRGDLEDFCLFAREQLGGLARDKQRDPHVRLFERERKGCERPRQARGEVHSTSDF